MRKWYGFLLVSNGSYGSQIFTSWLVRFWAKYRTNRTNKFTELSLPSARLREKNFVIRQQAWAVYSD